MSNRYSRIFHHISTDDLKRNREITIEKIEKVKKIKEEERSIFEIFKHDWRRELKEGMTSSDVFTTTIAPAEGDGTVTSVNPLDSANYNNLDVNGNPVKMYSHIGQEGGVGDDGVFDSAFVGTVIRDSGSGTGSDGGFDVGGQYLAFQGTGAPNNNARFAQLGAIDSTKIDTLTITAIVGNGSNGGETPDLIAECLFVKYKTPAMDRSQLLNIKPDITLGQDESVIIATPLDGQDGRRTNDGGLNNYSIPIPDYARAENTNFTLYQNFNSGNEFDNYGITDIKFQRKTPINVVVSLDSPEAVSFVRVGGNEGDPKKRKKKVNDQLEASDQYTTKQMGKDFPGSGARLGDETDPFTPASIQEPDASPIGKDEVKKSFDDFQQGQKEVEVLKTPEQIKAQNDEYYADLNNVLERGNYSYDDPQIVKIADKIIKLDPTSTDAYYYKSSYYMMTGEPEKGLKVIDQLIKNNPDDPDGYAVRSYYREDAGDLAGAIEDIEKTIELDPDSPYVSYYEMDLADLKYQEAEVETNNAIRDRMESEAGAIEAKAHEDYWNNADLIEQEEVAEYEYVDDETLIRDFAQGEFGKGMLRGAEYEGLSDNERANLESGLKRQVASYTGRMELPEVTEHDASNFLGVGYEHLKFYTVETWKGTAEEFADYYAGLELGSKPDEGSQILYNNGEFHKIGLKLFKTNQGTGYGGGSMNIEKIKDLSPRRIVTEFSILFGQFHTLQELRDSNSSPTNVRAINAKLKARGEYLQALSKALPEEFFEGGIGEEPINTLYDQMKALYDEEDPEREIKTELRAQGYEKQYKDLMTAWDSADKFSKFITPLKNLSDALLGSKTAQNAKYENYKIAIAKSIMLNKPIRVNPDTIDPLLIKKLGDRITPNQILSYDEEQRFKKTQEAYAKLIKQGKGDPNLLYDYDQPLATDGIPLIPIVSEAVPYADENIYEDEFGRVFTNDGSVANTTFQPDRGYHGFASAYVTDIMRKNPIAGRGQAQYQIVVPPDGSEPYLLYKDHAYHNMKSTDEGEVPGFMNQGAAGFVNWLGNTAHARSDGDANTGGMAGYPPNIRGDVITEFRIPITDLSEDVQGAVYRHPLMTEQPELVQLLRDKFYTDDKIKRFNIGGETGKELHNLYTNVILKRADQLKDFITDNSVELVLRGIGKITGAEDVGNITTASNMLQRYDDYIQQTVYTSDGRAYIPGVTTPDGNVVSRININDQFTKGSQSKLQQIMSDKDVQALVKQYVNKGKTEGAKDTLEMMLNTHIGDKKILGFALSNSLGGGAKIDVDEFLNGRLVIKKNYEFRQDDSIDNVGIEYDWSQTAYKHLGIKSKGTFKIAKTMANLFDVSNDAWAHHDNIAVATLASVATMTAARQLLRPVRNEGQSFAEAMNVAPTMPYKLEFDVSPNIMKILLGMEDMEDKDESDPRSGIAGLDEPIIIDKRKKNNKKNNVKESTLFEKIKKKSFFNQDDIKPTFPENPPPKLDPKTGMHPNYGKTAARYKKLDPASANAMPPTGDPEIDAIVDKQRTKPRPKIHSTFSKLKKIRKKN